MNPSGHLGQAYIGVSSQDVLIYDPSSYPVLPSNVSMMAAMYPATPWGQVPSPAALPRMMAASARLSCSSSIRWSANSSLALVRFWEAFSPFSWCPWAPRHPSWYQHMHQRQNRCLSSSGAYSLLHPSDAHPGLGP